MKPRVEVETFDMEGNPSTIRITMDSDRWSAVLRDLRDAVDFGDGLTISGELLMDALEDIL